MKKFNEFMNKGIDAVQSKINKGAAITLTTLATLFGMTEAQGQQVLKRTSNTSNATVVELFGGANGSTPNTIVGPNGVDVGSSSSAGVVSFYPINPSSVFDSFSSNNTTILTPPTIPNETIGNGTFQTQSNNKKISSNYQNSLTGQTLNISTQQEDGERDAVEDGNNNVDLLYTKISLPYTLNDGTPVPTGTWAVINSRYGVSLGSYPNIEEKTLVFQFDGTKRDFRQTARNGYPSDNLQSIDANGQRLGTEEFEGIKKDNSKIFPNPIEDKFSFDDGDNNTYEKFKYQFIDFSGRVIESGTLTENQPVSLSQDHKPGVEMIILEDEDGNKFSKKALLK